MSLRSVVFRGLAASVFSLLVVTQLGCDKIKEKLTEKAGEKAAEAVIKAQTGKDVKIDSKEGRVTVQGNDGVVTVGGATKIPDDFPKSAPIYPSAKVVGAMTTSGAKGGGQAVTFTSTDSVEKVTTFYKAEAAKAKHKERKVEMVTAEGGMIAWEADDGTQVSIIIGTAPEGTSIVVTAGKK